MSIRQRLTLWYCLALAVLLLAFAAVILVGGEGKRLRPLTSTVPKPVVPLVDRPFISFMLEWLRRHGHRLTRRGWPRSARCPG